MALLHRETTHRILGAFFEAYNALGYGFLESVYVRAMEIELRRRGCRVEREALIRVSYKGREVGLYRADLVVNESVIVEVKASRLLDPSAHRQLAHYLKATGYQIGLLLHFGPRPAFKRMLAPPDSRG